MWQTLSRQRAFHITSAPALLTGRRQIAMIGDLNLPQCRKYRVEQLVEFWQGRGVGFEYAHFDDTPRATRILQQATHLMEYRLQSTPLTQMLRYEAHRLRLPILYDLDDPLFSVSAYETYGNMQAVDVDLKYHFLKAAPSYLSMMNGADMVGVSTPGMAEHARLYTNRAVHVRRNFADRETLDTGRKAMHAKLADDGLFRVAFASGSQGHEADFQAIIEPLVAFLLAHPKRRLMILGHFDLRYLPTDLQGRVEQYAFTDYPSYLGALAKADCAVMPLNDDIFNGCKSAVRVLDAAAVGVPSVVADVGDLGFAVQMGKTGFAARSAADWVDALEQLAVAGNANKLGLAARVDLEARWQASEAAHIVEPEILRWVAA
jgi:glycosyltransferase involved in cell wall biosynthesis